MAHSVVADECGHDCSKSISSFHTLSPFGRLRPTMTFPTSPSAWALTMWSWRERCILIEVFRKFKSEVDEDLRHRMYEPKAYKSGELDVRIIAALCDYAFRGTTL